MIKIFTVIFFINIALISRENPFLPATDEKGILVTANKKIEYAPLQHATITLPSTARTVENITIKYKNLDGSVTEKTEKLGNSVDWHLPLFLSQKLHSSVKEKKSELELLKTHFVKISSTQKVIKISTRDKIIRNFMLTNPHRIVCDIKKAINMRSLEKSISKHSIVKKIRIGNHKGYYRIVIELDGHYKYHLVRKKHFSLFMLH